MDLGLVKDNSIIDGFHVIVMDELKNKYPEKFNESGSMDYVWFEKNIRPKNYIYVRKDKNSIAFTLKKDGQKGCELSTLIESVIAILEEKNKNQPVSNINLAIAKFKEGLLWLKIDD